MLRGIVPQATRVTQQQEAGMAITKKSDAVSQGCFESYAEYNRILRSWFVAFGMGGLALFLLESPVHEALLASGQTRTVVTLFLWPQLNLKLKPKLLKDLRPGTRIVSYMHTMGDWPAEKQVTVGTRQIYLWTVP